MSILIRLLLMFSKISLFSFGGGYVVISMVMNETESDGFIPMTELTNIIAIAGMSPGPVAVNTAVGLGYRAAGIPGVIASFLGIAVPCAVMVVVVAKFFFKVYDKPLVKAILYGLTPATVGIILYSAVNIAVRNGMLFPQKNNLIGSGINLAAGGTQLLELKSLLIVAATLVILTKTKIHPLFLILGSGIVGAIVF